MNPGRVILLVLDACGIGALPDAGSYCDFRASTIPNVAKMAVGLSLPNLGKLGLGNIAEIDGTPPAESPLACYGRMAQLSVGMDSIVGHWELANLITKEAFPLFPNGFPKEFIDLLQKEVSQEFIGNKVASGTEIIEELGDANLTSRKLILYTSADSVLQIASHESVINTEQLYSVCRAVRELCKGEFGVARVIARPFIGRSGYFVRTHGRKDFSIEPPALTLLDSLVAEGHKIFTIGKIHDLFCNRGITNHVSTADNTETMDALRQTLRYDHSHPFVFANCPDFDQIWGHRNDPAGFARGLIHIDLRIGEIIPLLGGDDILIITADHGCDPTLKHSTDHTREYVPLLVYGRRIKSGVNLGDRKTFADVAATISELFSLKKDCIGTSFLSQLFE